MKPWVQSLTYGHKENLETKKICEGNFSANQAFAGTEKESLQHEPVLLEETQLIPAPTATGLWKT